MKTASSNIDCHLDSSDYISIELQEEFLDVILSIDDVIIRE